MEIIEGIIETFIYRNDENGYSVIKLEDGAVAVGLLPDINEGELIELSGENVFHERFGYQFKFDSFTLKYPEGKYAVINYLSSGIIKGIGLTTAVKIYKKFGERTFDIFDNSIERLTEIDGIGKSKLDQIKTSWENNSGARETMIYLQEKGLSTNYSLRIFKHYGSDVKSIFESNPYKIIEDVWGIGFKIIDKIAVENGITQTDNRRINALILNILNYAQNDGHVYLPYDELLNKCLNEIGFQEIDFNSYISLLADNEKIVRKKDNVYLRYLYDAERFIETFVKSQLEAKPLVDNYQLDVKLQVDYSEKQIEAIQNSFTDKILIITGGPGTGKTTTLRGIIEAAKQLKIDYALAAPTGRAAKRMSEITGEPAKTIHRLLEYNPSENFFNLNQFNLLETELLIVDELSMVDTLLMANLLKAIDKKTNVVFIGDENQLPSVGPGNILKDLIHSEKIKVTKLDKIFRQASESRIVKAAHEIMKGEIPEIANSPDTDLFFISDKSETVAETILDLLTTRLPKYFDYDPVEEIQVIAPMYKGKAGVNNLNTKIQEFLNPANFVSHKSMERFKINDKVMQIKNNYDKDVYNGDIGFVKGLNEEGNRLEVYFGQRIVDYEKTEIEELVLAYAVTVHKSQGSEYPCIILSLNNEHRPMLQRNLLYTAITRAQKSLIIIGSKFAFAEAVNNTRIQKRYTSLFLL